MDNHIMWRCRHCKQYTAKVKFSQGKWPFCYACYADTELPKGDPNKQRMSREKFVELCNRIREDMES